ncbi:unnamed protein product [Choristocarpus tenellus]
MITGGDRDQNKSVPRDGRKSSVQEERARDPSLPVDSAAVTKAVSSPLSSSTTGDSSIVKVNGTVRVKASGVPIEKPNSTAKASTMLSGMEGVREIKHDDLATLSVGSTSKVTGEDSKGKSPNPATPALKDVVGANVSTASVQKVGGERPWWEVWNIFQGDPPKPEQRRASEGDVKDDASGGKGGCRKSEGKRAPFMLGTIPPDTGDVVEGSSCNSMSTAVNASAHSKEFPELSSGADELSTSESKGLVSPKSAGASNTDTDAAIPFERLGTGGRKNRGKELEGVLRSVPPEAPETVSLTERRPSDGRENQNLLGSSSVPTVPVPVLEPVPVPEPVPEPVTSSTVASKVLPSGSVEREDGACGEDLKGTQHIAVFAVEGDTIELDVRGVSKGEDDLGVREGQVISTPSALIGAGVQSVGNASLPLMTENVRVVGEVREEKSEEKLKSAKPLVEPITSSPEFPHPDECTAVKEREQQMEGARKRKSQSMPPDQNSLQVDRTPSEVTRAKLTLSGVASGDSIWDYDPERSPMVSESPIGNDSFLLGGGAASGGVIEEETPAEVKEALKVGDEASSDVGRTNGGKQKTLVIDTSCEMEDESGDAPDSDSVDSSCVHQVQHEPSQLCQSPPIPLSPQQEGCCQQQESVNQKRLSFSQDRSPSMDIQAQALGVVEAAINLMVDKESSLGKREGEGGWGGSEEDGTKVGGEAREVEELKGLKVSSIDYTEAMYEGGARKAATAANTPHPSPPVTHNHRRFSRAADAAVAAGAKAMRGEGWSLSKDTNKINVASTNTPGASGGSSVRSEGFLGTSPASTVMPMWTSPERRQVSPSVTLSPSLIDGGGEGGGGGDAAFQDWRVGAQTPPPGRGEKHRMGVGSVLKLEESEELEELEEEDSSDGVEGEGEDNNQEPREIVLHKSAQASGEASGELSWDMLSDEEDLGSLTSSSEGYGGVPEALSTPGSVKIGMKSAWRNRSRSLRHRLSFVSAKSTTKKPWGMFWSGRRTRSMPVGVSVDSPISSSNNSEWLGYSPERSSSSSSPGRNSNKTKSFSRAASNCGSEGGGKDRRRLRRRRRRFLRGLKLSYFLPMRRSRDPGDEVKEIESNDKRQPLPAQTSPGDGVSEEKKHRQRRRSRLKGFVVSSLGLGSVLRRGPKASSAAKPRVGPREEVNNVTRRGMEVLMSEEEESDDDGVVAGGSAMRGGGCTQLMGIASGDIGMETGDGRDEEKWSVMDELPTDDAAREWIQCVLSSKKRTGFKSLQFGHGLGLGGILKDGKVLCRLLRAVTGSWEDSLWQEQEGSAALLELVHLRAFIRGCRKLGVSVSPLFPTETAPL